MESIHASSLIALQKQISPKEANLSPEKVFSMVTEEKPGND